MSEWVALRKNAAAVDKSPLVGSYTRVTILIDDENEISVGNDSGEELLIECPWGTLAMANKIFAGISGFQYQPFTASSAILDPAAELGDGVTVDDITAVVAFF